VLSIASAGSCGSEPSSETRVPAWQWRQGAETEPTVSSSSLAHPYISGISVVCNKVAARLSPLGGLAPSGLLRQSCISQSFEISTRPATQAAVRSLLSPNLPLGQTQPEGRKDGRARLL